MFWITKYRHNKIVEEYQGAIKDLQASLNRRNDIVELIDKVTDITRSNKNFITSLDGCIAGGELNIPADVARYVDDYYGGKVIRQEATPVTILDENGKATYALTAKQPPKGKKYILESK